MKAQLGTALAGLVLAVTTTVVAQPAQAGTCNGAWLDVAGASAYIRNHQDPTGIGGGIQLQTRDCGPDRDIESRAAMLIYTPLRTGTDAVAGVYGRNGAEYCRIPAGKTWCATPPITGSADRIYGVVRRYLGDGVWDPYASGEWKRP